jgi:hypothetical protein
LSALLPIMLRYKLLETAEYDEVRSVV